MTPAPTTFTYTGPTSFTNGLADHADRHAHHERADARDQVWAASPVTRTIPSGSRTRAARAPSNASGQVSCTIPSVNQTSGDGQRDHPPLNGRQHLLHRVQSEARPVRQRPTRRPRSQSTRGTSDYNDAGTLSATLRDCVGAGHRRRDRDAHARTGTQSCTGVTGAGGAVSCSVTPNEPANTYAITGTFAGDTKKAPDLLGSTGSNSYIVTHEETAIVYTGQTVAVGGMPFTMSSNLTTDGNPLGGRPVPMTLGSGRTAQSCTGTTNATGNASRTLAA